MSLTNVVWMHLLSSKEKCLSIRLYKLWDALWHLCIGVSSCQMQNRRDDTGWVFSLVPPRKVQSMELVPPNREKWLSSPKVAKNPSEKVKVQVRVCQTFTFYCNLAGFFLCVAGCDLDFHFFSRDIAIFGELCHFFTIGWDQFHT